MQERKRGFEVISAYAGYDIVLPARKTKHSAGYDIHIAESINLMPRTGYLITTGIKAYMQPNEVLEVYIRSSLAKKGLVLGNAVGIIDADYYNNSDNEGHIQLLIFNSSDSVRALNKGERVAQGIFKQYLITDDDNAIEERSGGLGSTGK